MPIRALRQPPSRQLGAGGPDGLIPELLMVASVLHGQCGMGGFVRGEAMA